MTGGEQAAMSQPVQSDPIIAAPNPCNGTGFLSYLANRQKSSDKKTGLIPVCLSGSPMNLLFLI
jgi:hypothetical protein